jgi:hypothetical protein
MPLLYLAADWRLAPRWYVLFDFDGLADGPRRAWFHFAVVSVVYRF